MNIFQSQRFKALTVFALISFLIFAPHIFNQGVFVGDSDRMNHSLTIFNLYLEQIANGNFPLWSDLIFGGISLVSIPYQFPNPIVALAAIIGIKDVYLFAGFEAFILLTLAGYFSYLFLLSAGRSGLASITGAVLFQTCALSILKVSQNDMSFMVIVLLPLVLLLIKNIFLKITYGSYLILTFICIILFLFTFLQKLAYLGILSAAYSLWLLRESKNYRALITIILAVTPGILIGFPRLVTIAQDFATGNRIHTGGFHPSSFISGEHLPWYEILRGLDSRIFGSSIVELLGLGNSINLSEGYLLYMGNLAALITIYVMVKRLPWKMKDFDGKFAFIILACCWMIVFTSPGYALIFNIFGGISFIHYRILMIAILPSCLLIALFLDGFSANSNQNSFAKNNATKVDNHKSKLILVISVIAVLIMEILPLAIDMKGISVFNQYGIPTLQTASVIRIFGSVIILIALWYFFAQDFISSNELKKIFCTLLMLQSTIFAILFVWGPNRWNQVTQFKTPTNAFAHKGEFLPPSSILQEQIKTLLSTEEFRTSFVCSDKDVGINCPTRISTNLNIRTIDGYVSSIPNSLVDLKVAPDMQLRTITFKKIEDINWELMGLLNTRYGLYFNPGLFTNSIRREDGSFRELSTADMSIVENPKHVTPRAFFTKSIQGVPEEMNVLEKIYKNKSSNKEGYYPEERSVIVGNFPTTENLLQGDIDARFDNGEIVINMSPEKSKRFLVLNERYDKQWRAYDQYGSPLPVFPVNIFMRGTIVAPGISTITFKYEPFIVRSKSIYFYLSGAIVMMLGLLIVRKYKKIKRSGFNDSLLLKSS